MYCKINKIPILIVLLPVLFGCEGRSFATSPPEAEPYVIINQPKKIPGTQSYSTVTVFGWKSGGDNVPEFIRYLWSLVVDTTGTYNPDFDIVKDLNDNPWRYEEQWSPWIPFQAPSDSGRTTVIGDDEELRLNRFYIFAVQARDKFSQVTETFDQSTNVRLFVVQASSGPFLIIYEPLLHEFRFIGTALNPERRQLPPGIPFHFKWFADVSRYGGTIAGYRYGWDIVDLGKWETPYKSDNTSALEATFFSGVHTFIVESIDLAGNLTRGTIEIEIVPFPMDRNLLWVDDFASFDFPQVNWSMPTETQHDVFWFNICSRAIGFDPLVDVYDCQENNRKPPPIEDIGRYKNIIWTYSTSSSTWRDIVLFTPESMVGQSSRETVNYIAMFLSKGGHLWTSGRSDQNGGLASILPDAAQSFPMSLKCEITGNRDNCNGDRSGVYSMAYKDYCVSMLDKILGRFRDDQEMPQRVLAHYDVMTHAYRDDSDPVTAVHPGLPERLDLWEEVIKPGRYFDPHTSRIPGGFTYVEIYDPEYWMERNLAASQYCFHPLYRMQAKDEASALNNCTVAIWLTKYADIVPDVSSGLSVAAPSLHFGFPLWFFERNAVDSIVDVVFSEWSITPTP